MQKVVAGCSWIKLLQSTLKDYHSNEIKSDALLQIHDALPHGSDISEIKKIWAGIMITGNVYEANR